MLPLLPTKELDLTQIDRQSLLYRARFLASQVFPWWSDFTLNFPENVLLEACADMVAVAISVMNERFRQHSIATMTSRLSAIRKGRITGYTLDGASAAQVAGNFQLPNEALATKQVPLSAGLRLQSGDTIWRLTADATINVGNNASASVTLENAEEGQQVQTSEGYANEVIQLDDTGIIQDSIEVTAGNGDYTNLNAKGQKLLSFTEAGPDDRVFIAMLDNNGRAYIFFGDGKNGAIPQGTITIDYKTGGGESGSVTAGADWDVLDGVYDVDGQIRTVDFVNTADSQGGYDQTSIEEARIQIPLSIRTLERAVNEDDFEYAAMRVAGIARAALMTSNHSTAIGEDSAFLYPIAYGSPYSDSGYYPPAAPTSEQKAAIETAIDIDTGEYAQMMGLDVTVMDPQFKTINVAVRIYKENGYAASTVKTNITSALQQFLAIADSDRAMNQVVDFGYKMLDVDGNPDYKLPWSWIFNAINDAEGVREVSASSNNLLLNDAHTSIFLSPNEFPQLGSVTVYDMDQGGAEI